MDIWERQPGESQVEYKYFCIYRDLRYKSKTNSRSLKEASKKAKKSADRFERISAKNNWVARCDAYDDYIEKLVREKNENEIVEMAKRHARIATVMQNKGLNALQSIPIDDLKANDITTMLKTAVDIERMARGQATEKVDGNINQNVKVGILLPDNKRD